MASTLTAGAVPILDITGSAPAAPESGGVHIGLRRAFSAIALLFAGAAAVFLYFTLHRGGTAIAHAEAERAGLAQAAPVTALAAALSRHRQYAETLRAGVPVASEALAAAGNDVQKAFGAAGDALAQQPVAGTAEAWQAVGGRWKAIQAYNAARRVAPAAAYDDAGRALQKYMLALKDGSGLSVDGELGARYLIESATETAPALLDALSQPLPPPTLLDRLAGQLARDMGHAFDADPALRDTLAAPLKHALTELAAVYAASARGESGAGNESARAALAALVSATGGRLDGMLEARAQGLQHERWLEIGVSAGVVIIALLMLAAAARAAVGATRASEEQAARMAADEKRNQAAILQLLNEMADLASGNLNVRAQVTESMTGALADSINFTIEELHDLVVRVNQATDQVTHHVEQTRSISTDLFEASQKQHRDITNTSQQVLQVARSIREVSHTAEESAEVARRSLNAAEKGALAVGNSIGNMNDIRGLMQDTAKQIKRLGESSQEIGEIVELISDITEQTNVLALNASIQAASAGEAGRGFAIVAEEIQRLAERSAEATKQIGGLVRRIQHDTQESVAVVEKSTQGVVEGAKLSDAAGDALNEIRQVSAQLAEMIQTISDATRTQSTVAGQMLQNVQTILSVTKKTSSDTQRTNESIATLAALSSELRQSVSGFKL